jgi:hypothetical protein
MFKGKPRQDPCILAKARSWLTDLLQRVPPNGNAALRTSSYAVLGCWIADRTIAATETSLDVTPFLETASLASELMSLPENENYILSSVDSSLMLVVEVLLSSHGLTVPALRRFMSETLEILGRRDPELLADISLFEKRMLLYCMGILPSPEVYPKDDVRDVLSALSLPVAADQLHRVISLIECLTGWGTWPCGIEAYEPWVDEMVTGLAAHCFKRHDLNGGTRLLRLGEYLAASKVERKRSDLYTYLCALQNLKGAFGWFGPEEAELRRLSSDSLPEVELYLPATVDCLWTLAEAWVTDWRLLAELPRYEISSDHFR